MRTILKRLFVAAVCTLTLVACKDKGPTFTVEGAIKGAQDSTLYVYHRSLNGLVLLDSAILGSDGKFQFDLAAPDAPDFYLLQVNSQLLTFSVDSTETVTINGSMPGLANNYSVKGSENSERIRQITLLHSQFQQRVYELERNIQLMGRPMADSLQRMLAVYKDSLTRQYIYNNPGQASAYYALLQSVEHLYMQPHHLFDPADRNDAKAYRAVATQWMSFYPNSPRGQQLVNQVERDLQNERIAAAQQERIAQHTEILESGLIDLELPDDQGYDRTLTELKGKVVVLAFNFFADPQTPAQVLKLRELYAKYEEQDFEIYQVSIDPDDHFWRQAVENLPWVCVYDPQGMSLSRYNVDPRRLPDYFVINRQNEIVDRTYNTEDLEKLIQPLF